MGEKTKLLVGVALILDFLGMATVVIITPIFGWLPAVLCLLVHYFSIKAAWKVVTP